MGTKLHEARLPDGRHYSWSFFCPGCQSVHCVTSGWSFNGSSTAPTFSPPVLVHAEPAVGYPRCHSHVTNGEIAYCSDSTHALAGKTVPLPDWDATRFAADKLLHPEQKNS